MLRFFFANLFALFFVTVFIVACGGPELNSGKTTAVYDRMNPWEIPGETSEVKPLSTQTGNSSDQKGWAVATDSLGNVYVTGSTTGVMPNFNGTNAGYMDAYLIKYNSAGTKVWTRQFGTVVDDVGHSIAVDSNDNIYVGGHTKGSFPGYTNAGNGKVPATFDLFVVKYDSSGTRVWTRQWGTNQTDVCGAITVDTTGNVYFVGTTLGVFPNNSGSGYDGFVTKLDATGTELWTRQWDSGQPDGAYGVAVKSDGSVFVAGNTNGTMPNCNPQACTSSGGSDNVLLKYNSTGNLQMTRQWGSPGSDYIYSLALDNLNNLYMSGSTNGSLYGSVIGGYDVFVVKFDATCSTCPDVNAPLWSAHLGSPAPETMSQVAVEPAGANIYNVYIAGETTGAYDGQTAIGGTDFYITKFTVTTGTPNVGTKIWSKLRGSWNPTAANDETKSIALDKNGTVYVAGHTTGSLYGSNAGSGDMFLYKDAGEVARFRFEQDVTDATGNYTSPGSLYGGASFTQGYIGYGVQTDGINGSVTLADFNPQVAGKYSISMWVKPSGTQPYNNHTYIGKTNSSTGANIFSFYQDKSNSLLYVQIANSYISCSNVEPDDWTHYVLVMEEAGSLTNVKIYRNGEIICGASGQNVSGLINTNYNTGVRWIAGATYAAYKFYKGQTDDIRFYGKALSVNEVIDLSLYPQIDDNYSNSDILAKYNLDDSNLADSTGHGFTGANVSGSFTVGHEGSAAKFDGTTNYATLGTFDPRNGGDSYAISLWVKPEYGTETVPNHAYISLDPNDPAYNPNGAFFIFGYWDNTLQLWLQNAPVYITGYPEEQNKWTNYVISVLEKQGYSYISIYKNGALIKSETIQQTIPTGITLGPWSIGTGWVWTWNGLIWSYQPASLTKGQMDHVRFYSRQLNEKEALALYQYDDGMRYCSDSDLKGTCKTSRGINFDLSTSDSNNKWWIKSGTNWVVPKSSVNDKIASVKLSNDWEAYLCVDNNHNGTCKYFDGFTQGTAYNLVSYSFNATASSFTVQPESFEKAKAYYGFREIGESGNEPQGFAYFYENANYEKLSGTNAPRRLFMDTASFDSIADTTNHIIKNNRISSVELYGNVTATLGNGAGIQKNLRTSHRDFSIYGNDSYDYLGYDFRSYQDNVKTIYLNAAGDSKAGSIGCFLADDIPDLTLKWNFCLKSVGDLDEARTETHHSDGGLHASMSESHDDYYGKIVDDGDTPKFLQYGDNYDLLFVGAHGAFSYKDNSQGSLIQLFNWDAEISIAKIEYGRHLHSGIGKDHWPSNHQNEFTSGEWHKIIGKQSTDWFITSACNSMGTDSDPFNPNVINAWKYPLERLHGVGGMDDLSYWDCIDEWGTDWGCDSQNYNGFWNYLKTEPVSLAFEKAFALHVAVSIPVRKPFYITRENCDCTNTTLCHSYMLNDYFHGYQSGAMPDKGDPSAYSYYCIMGDEETDWGLWSYQPTMLLMSKNQKAEEYPAESGVYDYEYSGEDEIITAMGSDKKETEVLKEKGKEAQEKDKPKKLVMKKHGFEYYIDRASKNIGNEKDLIKLDSKYRSDAERIAQSLTEEPMKLEKIVTNGANSYFDTGDDSYEQTGKLIRSVSYVFSLTIEGIPFNNGLITVSADDDGIYKIESGAPKRVIKTGVSQTMSRETLDIALTNNELNEKQLKNGKIVYRPDKEGKLRLAYMYPDYVEEKTKTIWLDEEGGK